MRISALAARPVSWKNGGGVTRELALREKDGQMIWRLSLADITRDGPFTAFPGLARIHCIVEGDGHTLSNSKIRLEARPLEPLSFDGGLQLEARLRNGPCKAFNVIYDPARVTASAGILGACDVPAVNGVHVLFVVSGSLDLGEAGRFIAGEGIVTENTASGAISHGGVVIQVQFLPF